MRARCSDLTILVPDMAKSAATVICLGADHLILGNTGDLGPVDPQFIVDRRMVGAREILNAVRRAEKRIEKSPSTYPLYANLTRDLPMVLVERARSAMDRTYDLVEDALACSRRTDEENGALLEAIKSPLIKNANYHGASFGAAQARKVGLPVLPIDTDGEQWQTIWTLWTRYYELGAWPNGQTSIYEGRLASQVKDPLVNV
jgi:hypothetical protein